MLITCKCLNITVEATDTERSVGLESLRRASKREPESFFEEEFKEVSLVEVTKLIPSLIEKKAVGVWSVEYCLNCSVNCYATHVKYANALINTSLITTLDAIKHMKNHRDFSPVFNVIIQPVIEHKGNDIASLIQKNGKLRDVFMSLQHKLRDSIHDEVLKTEERIKSFSEQEYVQLEEFRSRATKDHKALARKIFEVQVPSENQDLFPYNSGNLPRRVQKVDKKTSLNRRHPTGKKSAATTIAEESGNECKGCPDLSCPGASSSKEKDKVAGSLDSEGLFVIEGMEDNVTNEPVHSEGESDSEHEDSGSHDEGIDIHRKRAGSLKVAKSLPVNVPVYSFNLCEFEHDDEPTDTVDIAASIRALARSVHGDTVFGDLPRPRFSTQI